MWQTKWFVVVKGASISRQRASISDYSVITYVITDVISDVIAASAADVDVSADAVRRRDVTATQHTTTPTYTSQLAELRRQQSRSRSDLYVDRRLANLCLLRV